MTDTPPIAMLVVDAPVTPGTPRTAPSIDDTAPAFGVSNWIVIAVDPVSGVSIGTVASVDSSVGVAVGVGVAIGGGM